ncbi:nucleotidyltransferase family protein [Yoonia sp. 2307UL14-13]|uniref:nucleotidyltransferase family protein n=1 Tax=Yoonia sp. 2307UL14-13 TaxID=3126506 RepID=UPI0030B5476F
MIPILILAAGSSSRMRGRDKLLEEVDGEPLLRVLTKRALATDHNVYVALPDNDHSRHTALKGLAVTALDVPEASEGMSGTMRGAIRQLPPCPAFMMLLGDLVAITTADMNTIFAAREAHPEHLIWRGATTTGKLGHPVIFDSSLRPEFDKLTGDGGGEQLVHPLRDRTHLTRFGNDRARFDLDTPEEWAAWRKST